MTRWGLFGFVNARDGRVMEGEREAALAMEGIRIPSFWRLVNMEMVCFCSCVVWPGFVGVKRPGTKQP